MSQTGKGMNPYIAGGLAGVLLVLSVLVAGNYFGASTSYVRTTGLIEQIVAPEHVSNTSYFMKYFEKDAGIDWQWMFVLGIFFGSFLSANFSGSYKWTDTPDRWKAKFGSGGSKRFLYAFFGGAIALFGVRMAGGCPSGHGLSGMAQLSISGLLAMVGFFAGGLIMARLIYGSNGGGK
ncbi:MAG: YeeE/YedE family protein [Proteobacteria bacterium]|nr:YeeE/YedE family protein [Pseudomonadota bacterium]MBU1611559.1 YeeE/YedE family protein [Pseudomonadota bacterium]